MTDRIEPVIRIPVDPERVIRLLPGEELIYGGIRVKTTIYVVTEVDLGTRQTVNAITIPEHHYVELRVAERE